MGADRRLDQARRHQAELVRRCAAQEQLEGSELAHQETGQQGYEWGDFDRLTPFSELWGSERGTCIDRVHIEGFLQRHRSDIHGRVLEIEDRVYTERFGGDAVESADVLDVVESNEKATWIADLCDARMVPSDHYDCLVFTQVLFLIPRIDQALEECWRMLKPGGTLLLTLPFASRIPPEYGLENDCWRFTQNGVRQLFEDHFGFQEIRIEALGDTWLSTAFLYGLAADDLLAADFERHEESCPLVFCVRATKQVGAQEGAPRALRSEATDSPRATRRARTSLVEASSLLEADSVLSAAKESAQDLVRRLDQMGQRSLAARERIAEVRSELARLGGLALDVGQVRGAAAAAKSATLSSAALPSAQPILKWCRNRFLAQRFVRGDLAPSLGLRWLEIGEPSVAAWVGSESDGSSFVSERECLDRLLIGDEVSPSRLQQRLAEVATRSYDTIFAWEILDRVADVHQALRELRRMIRPGGLLVLSAAATARTRGPHDLWRLVPGGLQRLVRQQFPDAATEVGGLGNLQTCAAALCGLGPGSLSAKALVYQDPSFPTLSVAVIKAAPKVGTPVMVEPLKPSPTPKTRPRATPESKLRKPESSRVGRRPRVLCYHRISPLTQAPVPELAISPDQFEIQLEILTKHFDVISLAQVLERPSFGNSGKARDRPQLALTFDDCGLDALEHAAPRLLQAGMPATFFATSAHRAAGTFVFWWDRLGRAQQAGLMDEEARLALALLLYPLDQGQQMRVLQEHGLLDDDYTQARDTVLDGDGLRELDALPGMTVAAHTRSHLALPHHSEECLIDEVLSNKIDLEVLLGREVDVIAWPYGDCNEAAVRVARRSGFRFALTVGEQVLGPGVDRYRVPRFEVTPDRVTDFESWLASF